ncbi:hypothetical protein [Leptolyngbya sp. FACHB-711]|uniref:hypothetical protein n=1 Tax=Leptolyngbya sp. FACHB-711 TaxID=2692813 RepID=UPI001686EC91|nr:hypothetical protein [Leptolyngbya sp. FACHB-711]MBD1853949.1 hypothetical protein [Cyanobacteria bacterium FACHB-502]MBD2025242.1 hypothetical protein [Leptolyngbya sp. FACHB-711]
MSTHLKADFDRLLSAFKAIGELKTELERQYWLSRTAAFHGLTRAEMRRLFSLWLLETLEGQHNG